MTSSPWRLAGAAVVSLLDRRRPAACQPQEPAYGRIAAVEKPTALCVSCRTVAARVGPCDCGGGPVVDLRTAAGRKLLRVAVWGPDERQSRLLAMQRAGAPRSTVGAIADAIDYERARDLPSSGRTFLVEAAGTLFAGIATLVDGWRDRKHEKTVRAALRPYGARGAPALASVGGGRRARLGVAAADGQTVPSPLRGESCLAFEISLRTDQPEGAADDLLWREAVSAGFAVRLDDGELVRVPAGPIRLSRAPAGARVSHEEARARLPAAIADRAAELPYVPSDAAFEHLLRPGDRVAVVNALEAREDAPLPKESPRAPARMALHPVGTPVVATLGD
jgi:hypothetical protein